MNDRLRNAISIFSGLLSIGLTIYLFSRNPEISASTFDWLLFALLITITSSISIPVGVGDVSLMPMVSLSSTFVIGVIPTAVAEILADLLYGLMRVLKPRGDKWKPEEKGFSLFATTTANITMHVLSVLAAGSVFYGLGGRNSLETSADILILITTSAVYIITNYLIAGLFLSMRSKAHLRALISHLKSMLVYEAIPLVFAPLLAMVHDNLGLLPFSMFAVSLIAIAALLRDQARTHKKLERRVQELGSLQAVGQSLSSSLDIHFIGETIYSEICKLMPANNFYLALWNAETDEVNFSVIYENNQRMEGQSRTSKQGLTEYVIQNKKALLIEKNVKKTCESLGIIHYGIEAHSWLGVPILARGQAIGMIAVQSFPLQDQIAKSYTRDDLEILNTLAAQASVAIQNAWLYTQTDEALAKRVQEVNSILNSTSDGIMLLNFEMRVIEINRALCQMLGINSAELLHKTIPVEDDNPLSILSLDETILKIFQDQEQSAHQDVIQFQGKREFPAERTISPVQDRSGKVIGWLCVFRDLTEQFRLEKIKEDLTRMLVHDLRSPIITLQSGLDMIEVMINDNDPQVLLEMVDIARTGSNRMLGMINELLNITQLESGELVLHADTVDLQSLLYEEILRFKPILNTENLVLSQNLANPLPTIQGDADLLQRVIHNILDNAVKVSPQGSQIEIWARPDPEQAGFLLVGIQDQGPGVKQQERELLFEKFFTNQETKSRRKGTGLGLYFCKLVVEAHGGKIWVESELGQGSNFIFSLPME